MLQENDALPRAREPPSQHFMRSNDTTNIFGKKLGESTEKSHYAKPNNRGRFSSVGRALDCRAEGRGFDSRGRTNTQGLKITEK